MSVVHLTVENFDNLVINSDKPVLVDFYATWCGPCQMVAPIVEEIAVEHPEYVIAKVNTDNQPGLAVRYQVENIPTLLVFKEGRVTNKAIGFRSKQEILQMFE